MKHKVPIRISRLFPNVTIARDATKTIDITVSDIDTKLGRRKEPGACALAKSCMRQGIADHAVIGIAYSWLIKNNVATRYKTSDAVAREIVSFDRHQDFAAGQHYKLSKVAPSSTQEGAHHAYIRNRKHDKDRKRSFKESRTIHRTADIRKLT